MAAADAFIDAIIEKPDDDGPRLQYADWLEETGDAARAEFIRVQLQLARLHAGEQIRPKLKQRERELLERHGDQWFGAPLPRDQCANAQIRPNLEPREHESLEMLCDQWFGGALPRDRFGNPAFRYQRGMLERVSLGGQVELARVATLARLGPIRELILSGLGWADLERVADMTNLNHLKHLEINSCALTLDGVSSLLRSSRTSQLSAIFVYHSQVSPGECRIIARTAMPRLRIFSMDWENFGVAGLESLLSAQWFGQLHSLQLSSNGLGSSAVQMLCDTRHPRSIASLDLSGNLLGSHAVRTLAASERWKRLHTLNLSDNSAIADDGIVALAQSPFLEPTHLLLVETSCTSRGARALAQSLHGSKVRLLNLSLNVIRSQGLAYLGESSSFTNCERLFLVRNEIDDDGLAAFAKSTSWRRLRHLNLGGNGIGVHGVKALTESEHLPSLTRLDIGYNRLRSRAAQVLAKWPGLARLKSCRINNNAIGDEGMLALARSPYLPQNVVIEARDTDVSEGAQQTIQAIAPNRFRLRARPSRLLPPLR